MDLFLYEDDIKRFEESGFFCEGSEDKGIGWEGF